MTVLRQLFDKLSTAVAALSSAVDRRPDFAWLLALLLVFAVVGFEASGWVINDYPGAMWHRTPRGDDIEIIQAKAATAGWKELTGYWTGNMIVGNGFYRPLSSCMFVLEYRLFGRNDIQWQSISVALHLLVALMLVWVTFVLLEGSFLFRLSTGVLAALFFGSPPFADRPVQQWILGWWPCQPDMLALLCGFALLAAAAQYARTHRAAYGAWCVFFFALGISFKEVTYVAGLGACLLLLRHRRCWPLLGLLAAEGLLLYAVRMWALNGQSYPVSRPTFSRLMLLIWPITGIWTWDLATFVLRGLPIWLALAAIFGLRRRLRFSGSLLVGIAAYCGTLMVTEGRLDDPYVHELMQHHFKFAIHAAMLYGLMLSLRRWPMPEMVIVTFLSVALVAGFPPVFGHYRYWGAAFGSLLAAVAYATLARRMAGAIGTALSSPTAAAEAPGLT